MSTPALNSNVGHFLHGVHGSTARSLFNGGSYVAATYVTATGVEVDLQALPNTFRSVKAILPIALDLSSGDTVTVDGSITHASSSGGSYSTLASFAAKVFANNTTATSVLSQVAFQGSADLRGAKRFVKVKFRHLGSSTTTGDIAVTLGSAALVFGGADKTPASSS